MPWRISRPSTRTVMPSVTVPEASGATRTSSANERMRSSATAVSGASASRRKARRARIGVGSWGREGDLGHHARGLVGLEELGLLEAEAPGDEVAWERLHGRVQVAR